MTASLQKYKTGNSLLSAFYVNYTDSSQWPYILHVEELCAFLNIKLIKVNDGDARDSYVGKVTQNQNGEVLITINMDQNQYIPRYRFTLAHEIAHYNLHLPSTVGSTQEYRDTDLTMFRKEDSWNREEFEANNFAAQLLMPLNKINQAVANILNSVHSIYRQDFIIQMADLFQVSNVAMEYRLIKLGVLK